MPAAKFKKAFDYRARKNAGPITSYLAKSYDDIPQSHYDAAAAAGALDGVTAKSPDSGTDAGGKTTGGKGTTASLGTGGGA